MALGTTPTTALVTALALTLVLSACVEYVRPAPETASAPIEEDRSQAQSLASAATPDVLTPIGWNPLQPPLIDHAPPFDLETGILPTLEKARESTHKYSRFVAKGDGGLQKLRNEGHLAGNGTLENPYILEDFYVDGELSITSTDKALIIREGYVNGQLKLNYIGSLVYVHHVYASDLRVNENVKRDGTNTGGLFHDNKFAFVGQIRHFVGEFMQNEIGPRPQTVIQEYAADTGVAKVPPGVVFNFDGFHTADVHHNKFFGQVDIKLHGHNHADCFVCPIHNHDDEAGFPGHDHAALAEDLGFRSRHSVRYVSLLFRDNEIRVPEGIGLRYNDRNHAGDDRTANSEPNEYLNDRHLHFQDITIRNNRIIGGSIQIDVFNAADENHPVQNRGILRLWDNHIEVHYELRFAPTAQQASKPLPGIHVRVVDGLELVARGNTIRFVEDKSGDPESLAGQAAAPKPELRGFTLEQADASNLSLAGNVVESGRFGAYAQKFTESVRWILRGNDFRTEENWRAKDTQHPPEEEP